METFIDEFLSAPIVDVKSVKTRADFEQFLKNAGFSARCARRIAQNGFQDTLEREARDGSTKTEAAETDQEKRIALAERLARLAAGETTE
jgi:hypothetical protein